MDLPITLDDLTDELSDLLPGCDILIDEETDEIIVRTNRREGLNGELERIEEEIDPDDAIFGGEELNLPDDE
jgi:hypothetical protein